MYKRAFIKNKIILETWNDLSLDPNSGNYIESVIGNQTKSVSTDGSQKYISVSGEYANKSKYIRIGSVARQTLDYLDAYINLVYNNFNFVLSSFKIFVFALFSLKNTLRKKIRVFIAKVRYL